MHSLNLYNKGLSEEAKTYLKIEGKAMIRNRYNYPTPPIRDIKGKETNTKNLDPDGNITSRKPNGQLLSHKVAKWLSKTK